MMRADLEFTFRERAAIAEYDGGLSRVDAERLSLKEIYESCMATGSSGILGELIRANRTRRDAEAAPTLADLGLDRARVPWGLARIVQEGATYRPAVLDEHGTAALVVPTFRDGGLVDLVAEELTTGIITTRLGVANVIGAEWIEYARHAGTPLCVFSSVRRWLRGGGIGVVVVDWKRIASELDDVAAILCSPEIADRLRRVTARHIPRPFVAVPTRGAAHAA